MRPNTVVAEFPREEGKAATPTWACQHFSVKQLVSFFNLSHDSITLFVRNLKSWWLSALANTAGREPERRFGFLNTS